MGLFLVGTCFQRLPDFLDEARLLYVAAAALLLNQFAMLLCCVSGHNDHARRKLKPHEFVQDPPAVQSRHAKVGDDNIKAFGSGHLDCLLAVIHRGDFVAFLGEELDKRPPDQEFIVNYEDFR